MNVSVVILVGLPGSGKSRLATSLMQYYSEREEVDIIHVEYDVVASDILKNMDITNQNVATAQNDRTQFSSESLEAWRTARLRALNILRSTISKWYGENCKNCTINDRKHKELIIIMDDNFHLRSMRRNVLKVCQEFAQDSDSDLPYQNLNIGMIIIYVDTPCDKCIENNQDRSGTNRFVPEEVIRKMNNILEPPNLEKAFFEGCSFAISDCRGLDRFYTYFEEFLHKATSASCRIECTPKNLVINREEERLVTLKSRVHRIDLILRLLVGAICRTKKSLSPHAIQARKEILAQYKKNDKDEVPVEDSWAIKKFEEKILCHVKTNEEAQKIKVTLEDSIRS